MSTDSEELGRRAGIWRVDVSAITDVRPLLGGSGQYSRARPEYGSLWRQHAVRRGPLRRPHDHSRRGNLEYACSATSSCAPTRPSTPTYCFPTAILITLTACRFLHGFYAGKSAAAMGGKSDARHHRLEEVVRRIVSPPLFPVEVEIFKARMEYRDFRAGDVLQPRSGVTIRTAPLDHPDGATGYRMDLAAIGGLHHRYRCRDDCIRRIMSLARAVDLMIFNCTYTEEEISSRVGWVIPRGNKAFGWPRLQARRSFVCSTMIPIATIGPWTALPARSMPRQHGTIVAREGLVVDLVAAESSRAMLARRRM